MRRDPSLFHRVSFRNGMRLVEAKDGWYVFHVAKRERVLLTHVLKMFPVGSAPVGPLSKSGDESKLAEHELALAEAMAEQRGEHKRLVDAFLGEDGRFAEVKGGFQVRLTTVQFDWLLRVLNEVRVGLWAVLPHPKRARAGRRHGGAGRMDDGRLSAAGGRKSWG